MIFMEMQISITHSPNTMAKMKKTSQSGVDKDAKQPGF